MIKKWKKIKTEDVYRCGKHYFITKDLVITPGGKNGVYYVIRKSEKIVIIIPIDKDGNIHMTLQHRYPTNVFSLEFPSGSCDKKEGSLAAAKRELLEEVELASNDWQKIYTFDEANGISDLQDIVYIARSVYPKKNTKKDPLDENLHKTKKYTYMQLKRLIAKGGIVDSLTLSAFAIIEAKGVFNKLK